MIRQMTIQDIPALRVILDSADTLMGQPMNPERKWHIENLITDYCSVERSPMKVFGWEEDGVVTSAIFAHYSMEVNAWCMTMLLSSSDNAKGGLNSLRLIKHAQEVGCDLGFYQYYMIVESSRERAYNAIFHKKVKSNFLYAVDEVVPARERPLTNLYWDWLFGSKTKELEVSVVHHWLPPEFRKKILNSQSLKIEGQSSF